MKIDIVIIKILIIYIYIINNNSIQNAKYKTKPK